MNFLTCAFGAALLVYVAIFCGALGLINRFADWVTKRSARDAADSRPATATSTFL